MMTEGKGYHAPTPVVVTLDRHSLWLCYDAAAKVSKARQYANHDDPWKRGHVGGIRVPSVGWLPPDSAPRFIGYSGEAATILFFNDRISAGVSVDDRITNGGDGGTDAVIFGTSVQIKTRREESSTSKDGVTLVRCRDRCGRSQLPTADVVVCCELRLPSVLLLGWCYADRVKAFPEVPARKGNHTNIEIPDERLEPMARLIDYVIARKELP